MQLSAVRATIGTESFCARLRHDLAPRSCAALQALLPYRGKLIHARWSGEACWSPLQAKWPAGTILAAEYGTAEPQPGQILLYAGEHSEPELLIVYGTCRFACSAGPLEGSPVLTLEDRSDRLAELGRAILWNGAMDFCIERET